METLTISGKEIRGKSLEELKDKINKKIKEMGLDGKK
tara:strand:- start:902 stop:1012 length:111 start_codon:yes stop_codon:yes gene_type:complete